jgi:hypothetical protein
MDPREYERIKQYTQEKAAKELADVQAPEAEAEPAPEQAAAD